MKDYHCIQCGCELLALGEANDIYYYTCEICGSDYSFEYKQDGITAVEVLKD